MTPNMVLHAGALKLSATPLTHTRPSSSLPRSRAHTESARIPSYLQQAKAYVPTR